MEGGAYARAIEEARGEFAAGVPEVMATSAGVTFVAAAAGAVHTDAAGAAAGATESTAAGRAAADRPAALAGASGMFPVPCLDRMFQVTYPEGHVDVLDRGVVGEATVAETVIVLHYLARSAGALDLSDPVRFQGLPGAGAYVSAFRGHTEVPLIRRFGDDGRAFTAAARALGGAPAGAGGTAAGEGGGREDAGADDDPEVMWRLPLMPCLPIGVRLGLAEDGLPAECVLMFPRRAGFVQHVEDLAVAGELLSARLLAAADAAATSGAPGDEIATLITVYDPVEAEIIVAKLRSAGIDAIVRHDALSVVYGLTVDGAGRSDVLVRAADLPEARGALQETSDEAPM